MTAIRDKPKVLVCGGMDFEDRAVIYANLDRLHADRRFGAVIAGGARGADTPAVEWAKNRGIPFDLYMADWETLGRKAGPIRNQRMFPDLVVIFPGRKGTAGMLALARKAGVNVLTVRKTGV